MTWNGFLLYESKDVPNSLPTCSLSVAQSVNILDNRSSLVTALCFPFILQFQLICFDYFILSRLLAHFQVCMSLHHWDFSFEIQLSCFCSCLRFRESLLELVRWKICGVNLSQVIRPFVLCVTTHKRDFYTANPPSVILINRRRFSEKALARTLISMLCNFCVYDNALRMRITVLTVIEVFPHHYI